MNPVSPAGLEEMVPLFTQRSRPQLWNFLADARYIPRPALVGRQKASLIFTASDHLPVLENSDPSETSRGISPLCCALRLGNPDAFFFAPPAALYGI